LKKRGVTPSRPDEAPSSQFGKLGKRGLKLN